MNSYRHFIKYSLALALICLVGAGSAFAEGGAPSVGNLFIQAYNKKDEAGMKELIRARAEEFPGEVQQMVGYAMSPEAAPEQADFLFNISGIISMMYGEHTGDKRLLAAVEANYTKFLENRDKNSISADAVAAAKKDLLALGKGNWRITHFGMEEEGLMIDIDVRESSGGSMTPRVEFAVTKESKEVISKHLPSVKKGKITWSSLGVGLRTVFIE